jgi:hypothetical protein
MSIVQSPLRSSADPDWQLDYCNIERVAPDEISRRRAEFHLEVGGQAGAKGELASGGQVRPG